MNVAQQRLSKIAAWFEHSSLSRPTPNGNGIHAHGKFATIVPMDFADAPSIKFDSEAVPIFVDSSLANGLQLPAIDLGDCPSQLPAFHRLGSIIFNAQDYKLASTVGIFALTDPDQSIQAAIDAVGGLAGLDPAAIPVLAVPIWQFSFNRRRNLAAMLPFRPKADAIDPPDGPWHTPHEPPKPKFELFWRA